MASVDYLGECWTTLDPLEGRWACEAVRPDEAFHLNTPGAMVANESAWGALGCLETMMTEAPEASGHRSHNSDSLCTASSISAQRSSHRAVPLAVPVQKCSLQRGIEWNRPKWSNNVHQLWGSVFETLLPGISDKNRKNMTVIKRKRIWQLKSN